VSPAAVPAPGGMPGALEALAAGLAARGCRARLVTRPGGLPFLSIAGKPGNRGERICALPRRDGTRACWRRPVAGSARRIAHIIAGPAAPGGQLPAAGPGAGHHRAGGAGRLLAREAGMPGPSPDPGRRQAPEAVLARVLPGPVPGILPPACPRQGRGLARAAGHGPAAVPAGPGRP
jgi:hypothetical protein